MLPATALEPSWPTILSIGRPSGSTRCLR